MSAAAATLPPLDRKGAPTSIDGATFNEFCLGLWSRSRQDEDRRKDSWIGLTSFANQTFYMFPAFASSLSMPPATTAAEAASESTKLGRARGNGIERVAANKVVECYGDGALTVNVMITTDGKPTFDGICHREAIALINRKFGKTLREDDVLGWSIRPLDQGFLIRYSSGRNNGKFPVRPEPRNEMDLDYQLAQMRGDSTAVPPLDTERKAVRDARETRDLPRAWAKWIREVLMSKLMLVFDEDLSHLTLRILEGEGAQRGRMKTEGRDNQPGKWARADLVKPA